ncbi:MAG: hypothetical protein Q9167_003705 [Letrouitia subvulpina]
MTEDETERITALVTKAIAQIYAANEVMFQVDKNHHTLCDIDVDGPLNQQLVPFFNTFAKHAQANVQLTLRPMPNHEVKNPRLRTKSSISSFKSDSRHTPETEAPNEDVQQIQDDAQRDAGCDVIEEPSEDVELPFSHIASVSRNQKFYFQKSVVDRIDGAFDLKDNLDTHGVRVHNQSPHNAKSFVLCGMGGLGKTEIAIEYLYSRRDRFDAIFWIYADTVRKLAAQFVALAKELGSAATSEDIEEVSAREIVKGWLASPVGYYKKDGRSEKVDATWLLVFNNADNPDILGDWIPTQGPGCILVTSRFPYVKMSTYYLRIGLELQPLSPEIGGDMLRQLSEREQETNAVSSSIRIAELLGGLPLAISQMSAIIQRDQLTLQEFEEWYHEDSKGLHSERVPGKESDYQYTIATVWAIEQLELNKKPVFSLLKVLAILDPDIIPEDLLHEDIKDIELPDYPKKGRPYFNARADLLRASLVKRNIASNELRIHRLLQDVVRHKMSESELHILYASAASLLHSAWPYVSGTDPSRNQSWRVPIAEKYIFERGLSDQTVIFASLAKIILEKAVEENSDDQKEITHWLGEAHHNLSLAAVHTGSSDGMEDVKIWLDILRDRIHKFQIPSDQLSLATAYNQLGMVHCGKHQNEDVINSWKESVAIFGRVKGHPQFSDRYPRISLAMMHVLQDQADEAVEILKPTLKEHEQILGKEDTSTSATGQIWQCMRNIRNLQHRYKEAIEYHKRTVMNMRITLGENHYFTGDCFYRLGLDWKRQGNNSEARSNLDIAINIFTGSKYSKEQAARAMWTKGCWLKDAGDLTGSERLFQKAMDIWHLRMPDDTRLVHELQSKDWSHLITYWSR